MEARNRKMRTSRTRPFTGSPPVKRKESCKPDIQSFSVVLDAHNAQPRTSRTEFVTHTPWFVAEESNRAISGEEHAHNAQARASRTRLGTDPALVNGKESNREDDDPISEGQHAVNAIVKPSEVIWSEHYPMKARESRKANLKAVPREQSAPHAQARTSRPKLVINSAVTNAKQSNKANNGSGSSRQHAHNSQARTPVTEESSQSENASISPAQLAYNAQARTSGIMLARDSPVVNAKESSRDSSLVFGGQHAHNTALRTSKAGSSRDYSEKEESYKANVLAASGGQCAHNARVSTSRTQSFQESTTVKFQKSGKVDHPPISVGEFADPNTMRRTSETNSVTYSQKVKAKGSRSNKQSVFGGRHIHNFKDRSAEAGSSRTFRTAQKTQRSEGNIQSGASGQPGQHQPTKGNKNSSMTQATKQQWRPKEKTQRIEKAKTSKRLTTPDLEEEAPVHHIMRIGSSEVIEPLGQNCWLCDDDLAYHPADLEPKLPNPANVAVLPCGHAYHVECLDFALSGEAPSEPPCFVCNCLSSTS